MSEATHTDSPLVVRLTPKLRAALDKEAERLAMPVSVIVRRVLSRELTPDVDEELLKAKVLQLSRQISKIAAGLTLAFVTVGAWTLGTVLVL